MRCSANYSRSALFHACTDDAIDAIDAIDATHPGPSRPPCTAGITPSTIEPAVADRPPQRQLSPAALALAATPKETDHILQWSIDCRVALALPRTGAAQEH